MPGSKAGLDRLVAASLAGRLGNAVSDRRDWTVIYRTADFAGRATRLTLASRWSFRTLAFVQEYPDQWPINAVQAHKPDSDLHPWGAGRSYHRRLHRHPPRHARPACRRNLARLRDRRGVPRRDHRADTHLSPHQPAER